MGSQVVPPEAQLIRERRETRPPFYSGRAAAAEVRKMGVSMSSTNLADIESGRYNATPDKLAALARLLDISPEELDELAAQGRENAARAAVILREYIAERAASEPALADAGDSVPEAVLQAVLAGIDEIRALPGLSDAQKTSMEKSLIRASVQQVRGQVDQMRATLEIVRENSR